MAVTGKEKQVAEKGKRVADKGKQVMAASRAPALERKKRAAAEAAAAGSGGSRRKKRTGVLQFFDDAAAEADDSDEEEESDFDANDLRGDALEDVETEPKGVQASVKSHRIPPFLVKEEELSGDELEELIRDRYGHASNYVVYDEDTKDLKDGKILEVHGVKDPTIWKIKSMVGKERQIAFSLMQKFIDLQGIGTKLQIISVFTLDHVKGCVYIEADKACDVVEACKGFLNVNPGRMGTVSKNEIPQLLSTHSKSCDIENGSWVRVRSGYYKGDLAQVTLVDEHLKLAMIKLVPRIDLQALAKKFGGGVSLKHAGIPAPRLISSYELEDFRPHIQVRQDRLTGEFFDVLDGLMFKDGYIYKKVSLASIISWGVQPSKAELLLFVDDTKSDKHDDSSWIDSIYNGVKKSRISEISGNKIERTEASKCVGTKEGRKYVLHDLVLFGSRAFGVITDAEGDCFQILKGDVKDTKEPEVVTMNINEIRSVCVDKMFTASDNKMKTIYLDDTIKVLEGPQEGREGTVMHMYRGILFIYDDHQSENSGLFTIKSVHCEKIKESKRRSYGGKSNLKTSTSTNFSEPSSSSFNEQEETQGLNSSRQKFSDQAFSIGQTVRIRKGPLKGYLCRVVRIHRKDVTVKLDSRQNTLTVDENLLSAVVSKRDDTAVAPCGNLESVGDVRGNDHEQSNGLFDSTWDGNNSLNKAAGSGGDQVTEAWIKPSNVDGTKEGGWNTSDNTATGDTDLWEKPKLKSGDGDGGWAVGDQAGPSASILGTWKPSSRSNLSDSLKDVNGGDLWNKAGNNKVDNLEQSSGWVKGDHAWDTKQKGTDGNEAGTWHKAVSIQEKNASESKDSERSFDKWSEKADHTAVNLSNQAMSWDKAAAQRSKAGTQDGDDGGWSGSKAMEKSETTNWGKKVASNEVGDWSESISPHQDQSERCIETKSTDAQVSNWGNTTTATDSLGTKWEKVKPAGDNVGEWSTVKSSRSGAEDGTSDQWANKSSNGESDGKSGWARNGSSWPSDKVNETSGPNDQWGSKPRNSGSDQGSGWGGGDRNSQQHGDRNGGAWIKPMGSDDGGWSRTGDKQGKTENWGRPKPSSNNLGLNIAEIKEGSGPTDQWASKTINPRSGGGCDGGSGWGGGGGSSSQHDGSGAWKKPMPSDGDWNRSGDNQGQTEGWGRSKPSSNIPDSNWDKSKNSGGGGSGCGGDGSSWKGHGNGSDWKKPSSNNMGLNSDKVNEGPGSCDQWASKSRNPGSGGGSGWGSGDWSSQQKDDGAAAWKKPMNSDGGWNTAGDKQGQTENWSGSKPSANNMSSNWGGNGSGGCSWGGGDGNKGSWKNPMGSDGSQSNYSRGRDWNHEAGGSGDAGNNFNGARDFGRGRGSFRGRGRGRFAGARGGRGEEDWNQISGSGSGNAQFGAVNADSDWGGAKNSSWGKLNEFRGSSEAGNAGSSWGSDKNSSWDTKKSDASVGMKSGGWAGEANRATDGWGKACDGGAGWDKVSGPADNMSQLDGAARSGGQASGWSKGVPVKDAGAMDTSGGSGGWDMPGGWGKAHDGGVGNKGGW